MNTAIVEAVAGTTLKLTWVASGVTPSGIYSHLVTGSEAIMSTVAGVSSGNGAYYALVTLPNSDAWYVNKWYAYIGTSTYVAQQLVHAHKLGV
jgi:hypothetical protein